MGPSDPVRVGMQWGEQGTCFDSNVLECVR